MINLGLISLGCAKNQVDSEIIKGILKKRNDIRFIDNLNKADVIFINTCGFIQDAKEESIETILEAGYLKKHGKLKALIVGGCLTQRYSQEIMGDMPEVDAVLGTGTFDKISEVIDKILEGNRINKVGKPGFEYSHNLPRIISEPHYSYVKIAEGCNNNCTYCSIPSIRGPQKSRYIEDIFHEVNELAQNGVKEIILIAQDTTQYGKDLYGSPMLVELLKNLLDIKEINWIRLLYSYPEHIDDSLIKLMGNEEKICSYLDIPVQHSSNKIRNLMNRSGTREELISLINNIREKIPNVVLRTSLIVGFPGEDDKDFKDLYNFVTEIKFDRLGVFKYSREEGTAAFNFSGHVIDKIKEERFNKIMELQQKISLKKNKNMIGRKISVIVDEVENGTAIARSQYDAPEIDNQIFVKGNNIKKGDMLVCEIKDAFEYDLIGEKVYEFTK